MADLTKLEQPEMNLKTRFHSGLATPLNLEENPKNVANYLIAPPVKINCLPNCYHGC